jgi:hypothetical protein
MLLALLALPLAASAHEAYVVPTAYFWTEMNKAPSLQALDAWRNPHDVWVTVCVVVSVLLLLAANFAVRRTGAGRALQTWFESFAKYGEHFTRAAIVAALFFSARSGAFLGPELPLSALPFPELARAGLYAASALTALGFLTELAGTIGLLLFGTGLGVFGAYTLTYLNYFGELLVLFLFGMRSFSLDGKLRGKLTGWQARWSPYASVIVRVCYGLALMYAAITVKFLHPELTEHVVTTWNLTQFHWLFPSDPTLVTLGAGLAEFAIGFFILVGFELRLTTLISLFYITLSLLYFRELVWPHLLLYGISFNMLVQPETFTLDHLLFSKRQRTSTTR